MKRSITLSAIAENLQIIKEKIAEAAKKSGRKPEDITLVAVTKTIEAERINEVLRAGVTVIGENRVQELLSKQDAVNANPCPQWHLIGHLQTNKVKSVIDKVGMIQSVDSLRLAETINKCAARLNKIMDILIEVNIEKEDSKYGIHPEQLSVFFEKAQELSNVRLCGLMSIPPIQKSAEFSRKSFEKLERLFVDIQPKDVHNCWHTLSMGMSGDFREAIEEGSNMVRIGTALFGTRNPT
jgi:pyridoxal phosphate enzyme (YggS family)